MPSRGKMGKLRWQCGVWFCRDGVSRSGLFCAICNILSRLTLDQDVDVFMTVREIQSVLPEAVTSEVTVLNARKFL